MKKVQLLGLALVAVFAFSAMAAVSAASGAVVFLLALWLHNGAEVTSTMPAETEGEVLLENTKVRAIFGSAAKLLCSGFFMGTVGPNSAGEITEILTLSGGIVSRTPLVEPSLDCTNQANCPEIKLIWAVHLPWATELELWEEGTESGYVVLILPHAGGGLPGWYVECSAFGIKLDDECTGEGATHMVNQATGVEGIFLESFTLLMELKNANCTEGSEAETGIVEGTGLEKLTNGEVLAASSQ